MGIGKAVAKQLAIQEKAKLCILDVNEVSLADSDGHRRRTCFAEAHLDAPGNSRMLKSVPLQKEGLKTVDEITESGGTAYFFRCDVSDPESLNSIAAEIRNDPKLGESI